MKKSIQMMLAATALVAFTSSYAMAADTAAAAGVSAGVSADGTNGANGGAATGADANAAVGANTTGNNNSGASATTVTTDANGNVVLGTEATANASPEFYSKMTAEQQDNIKKTCAGKELGDKVMKDCKGFGMMN